jgi:hypothetical protein
VVQSGQSLVLSSVDVRWNVYKLMASAMCMIEVKGEGVIIHDGCSRREVITGYAVWKSL